MDFLFLSKILPLFVYPLGLSCLLILLALLIWWKYPRFTPIPLVFAILILFISSNGWFSNWLLRSLEWQYIVDTEQLPTTEAIVILGGCTKSPVYPRPMVDVSEYGDRLFYGAKLYDLQKAPLVIASGGRIEWLSGKQGNPEAVDMQELLMMLGVPKRSIILETNSLNTYQNAVNTKKILEQLQINRILLVTSAFHMPRAMAIFKKQNFDVVPAPTDFFVTKDITLQSNSLESNLLNLFPSPLYLDRTTLAIKEYIGMLVYRLKGWL